MHPEACPERERQREPARIHNRRLHEVLDRGQALRRCPPREGEDREARERAERHDQKAGSDHEPRGVEGPRDTDIHALEPDRLDDGGEAGRQDRRQKGIVEASQTREVPTGSTDTENL
jgi:hypothetical protein